MEASKIIFWLLSLGIFYAYFGYGILVYLLIKLKRIFIKRHVLDTHYLPTVTLLVAAYNEEKCIEEKIINSLNLDYPKELLNIVFVTDGSTDQTNSIISKYDSVQYFHKAGRNGKVAAINRIMPQITSEITIFSDANAMLNATSVKEIVKHFSDSKVGVVAGEKRINNVSSNTAEISEGIYWKYESYLKKLDSELYSAVGAAGELYAIRTDLFEELEQDTILDDFMLSLRICEKGYKTAYEPNAFAVETASANAKEELKRKIRICAGGFQSIFRLKNLLNPFRHRILSFQYISHRVLRWIFVPFALILLFILNTNLVNQQMIYQALFFAQIVFYTMSVIGFLLEQMSKKIKIFYLPYYFSLMNYSAIYGFIRFIKNQQSVVWEKAERA